MHRDRAFQESTLVADLASPGDLGLDLLLNRTHYIIIDIIIRFIIRGDGFALMRQYRRASATPPSHWRDGRRMVVRLTRISICLRHADAPSSPFKNLTTLFHMVRPRSSI